VLERDYCLAWFLAVLSESDLKKVLAFKGGTALKRCYFSDYRFSEDLDFTLVEPVQFEEIVRRLEPVYAKVKSVSGITFAFDREDRQRHSNSYTCYLKYTGPLPAGNDVKVDITLSERLVFPLEERVVLRGYEEFGDVPEDRVIKVYSLGEICAEKTIALADRARNEPRDLYDLWYLTTHQGVEMNHLTDAICEKLDFRGKKCAGIEDAILRKEQRLRALWSTRLAYQMSTLPQFEEVFRAVRRTLRQADLP
jgi:predicted nucleotidyltransferase component of viral defense system